MKPEKLRNPFWCGFWGLHEWVFLSEKKQQVEVERHTHHSWTNHHLPGGYIVEHITKTKITSKFRCRRCGEVEVSET